MKRIVFIAVLAVAAIIGAAVVFHAASSSDSSSRKAAIGSSTPAAGDGSITAPAGGTFAGLAGGAPVKVSSWSWGGSSPTSYTTGSGASVGKVQFSEFQITKNIDNASSTLFKALAIGQMIPTLTFKQGTALTYTFTNVFIMDLKQTGSGGADGDETVSFAWKKFCMANSAAGTSPTQCYDFATGTVTPS